MRFFLIILFVAITTATSFALPADSTEKRASVLVIPYNPSMHLSDADPDIANGSEMQIPEMREAFRKGIVKALNKNFAEVYDVPGMKNDFTSENSRDIDVLYHALLYETDSVYTLKNPARFAVKDSTQKKTKKHKDVTYMNVGIADETLIPDYSEKYHADYFIFLNEIDIKTHSDDCINLAMQIYSRDIKVHYSIFDKTGKQIYGDVAVTYSDTGSNDMKEIRNKNLQPIADYIMQSFNRAIK